MNTHGLALIKQAYKLQEVERIPWVPFVGSHAASLIGVDVDIYSLSGELMLKGLNEAIRRYKPDGIPVAFDLQLEAEQMGCDLVWAKDNPPSVTSHPLSEGKTLSDLPVPSDKIGRLATILDVTRTLRKQHPELALYGLICGPFTLALHLLGTEIFMKMFTDETEVHEVMTFCNKVCRTMSDYYIEAGCDVIAVVDPMCSQIGPDQFNQFVAQYATELFTYLREKGVLNSMFVCGHAQHNIEVMCACKPDNISIDENIPLDYVRDVCLKNNVSFGGNIKLTLSLLMGDTDDSRRDALSCMDIGGKRGYILAPGCDLAYHTPPANLEIIAELVHDEYQQQVVRALAEKKVDIELINLDEYGNSPIVKVDVITLDSISCAPCQYMVEAVKKACERFGDKVEWNEHSVKNMDGVRFMVSAGVQNIPTTLIDGKVKFISRIPPVNELIKAIEERIAEK